MDEQGFRRLKVWQESHKLTCSIYNSTKKFPKDELFGLTNQIRRASVSIPANIVEGYARSSRKEFLQFLSIAIGSLGEVEYYLQLSHDLKYMSREEYLLLEEQRSLVGKLLYAFIKSIKSKL